MKKHALATAVALSLCSSTTFAASYYMVLDVGEIDSSGETISPLADRLAAWDDFAVNVAGDASPPSDWLDPPDWGWYDLGSLPTEHYPVDQSDNPSLSESIGPIYLSKNQLEDTHLDSLSNIKGIKEDLYLSENNLTSLNGLSGLQVMSASGGWSTIDVSNNNLTDISGLSGLSTYEGGLSIHSNPNLEDVTPLASIDEGWSGSIELTIDDRQYATRMDISSLFCQDKIANMNGTLKNSSGIRVPLSHICISSSAWENWAMGMTGEDWATSDFLDEVIPDWSNVWEGYFSGHTVHSLPTSPYPVSRVDYMRMESTGIDQIDGFSSITQVIDMQLQNNALTNVNGLSSLVEIGDKDTANYGNLDLSNNNLTDISGLSSLTTLEGDLKIHGNGSLEDISPLQNISYVNGEITIDTDPYLTKMPASSPLCGLLSAEPWILVDSLGNSFSDDSNVCL